MRGQASGLGSPNHAEIIKAVRPYSMVSDEGLRFTIDAVHTVLKNRVGGAFVECGVWKGGASIAMLLAQMQIVSYIPRTVHMLDSFEGLPEATLRDGPAAIAWQRNVDAPEYYNNCRASCDEVGVNLMEFGFNMDQGMVWPGPFMDTIPFVLGLVDKIALLRLDCDWYASTTICLRDLGTRLSKGAIVILDDYYAWDGCARAVHEYLALWDLPHRIRQIGPNGDGAYFVVGD